MEEEAGNGSATGAAPNSLPLHELVQLERAPGARIGWAGSAATIPNGGSQLSGRFGIWLRDGWQTIEIGFMNTNKDIHELENELEQERRELRDTVNQIDRKIGRARDQLDPARFVRRHPFALMSTALCLGFLVGAHPRLERLVWGRGN